MRFETVPPMGEGALVIKHDMSLERLFRYSHQLKLSDVRPGEKFGIEMNPQRLFAAGWWTLGGLGDELEGKKFAKWERPDEKGEISNLMPGEQLPDVEQMEKDGWVFSEFADRLNVMVETQDRVVVEFVE